MTVHGGGAAALRIVPEPELVPDSEPERPNDPVPEPKPEPRGDGAWSPAATGATDTADLASVDIASPAPAAGPEVGLAAPGSPVPDAVDASPPPPVLRSWRELVAFVAARREATLHGHLRHCAHLVRWSPPVIELRLEREAPRDLSQRLAKLLLDATGTRWTIALSRDAGEPTLAEQQDALDAATREAAAAHPLVQAIMRAFPGATLGPVRDTALDEYGLPPEILPEASTDEIGDGGLPEPGLGDEDTAPDLEFAPLDSEFAGFDDFHRPG
ncbi:hypothetical protein [Rhizosaccharibacter radicis]